FNLGVRGYGLDQIYLRFQQIRPAFHRPLPVFGVVTVDLDRSLLSFRTGQKPYFTINDDKLVLNGRPIETNPEQWLERHPPQIYSLLYALMVRQWDLISAKNALEIRAKREEKEKLNSRILEEMVTE